MGRAKGQNYMHGAAILTIGVIIMKLLGFIYKIPLGNILGDEGYSMFLSAYNIYNVFFALATAGLPVALSRLVAEADANGRARQEEKTFRVARRTFFVIGLVFALILFLLPDWLAATYLENPDAAPGIRAMAPAILLVCLVSAYRGYCQGNGNMIPTTVDEVLEVLFKVISGLILASVAMKQGLGRPTASAGAILGVSIGSVVSLLYMVFYKCRNYDRLSEPYSAGIHDPNDTPDDDELVDSTGTIIKNILSIGVPIAFGACIMAILNSIDSKLCMNRLQSAAGFSYYEAKVLYGVYGKAQTLFNLPAAFITPLTVAIVPAISGAIARRAHTDAAKIGEDSMRISAVIGMPDGRGAYGAGRSHHERPLPEQQRGRPRPSRGDGHSVVLRVRGADGKRHSSGLRQGEVHDDNDDRGRPCQDTGQLAPRRAAANKYLRRAYRDAGELYHDDGSELRVHVRRARRAAAPAQDIRPPADIQSRHGRFRLGGVRSFLPLYRLRLEADGGEHAARGHCRGGDLRRVRRGAARGNERGYEAHPRRRKDSKTAAYPLSAGIAKKL